MHRTLIDKTYDRIIQELSGTNSVKNLASKYSSIEKNHDLEIDSLINEESRNVARQALIFNIMLYQQMRIVLAIAYIKGYDIKDPDIRVFVYLCLLGNKADEVDDITTLE